MTDNSAFRKALAARKSEPASPRLGAGYEPVAYGHGKAPHLIVKAGAGSGKTFTLVEGVKRILGKWTPGVKGSEQQEAVWEAMRDGGKVGSAAFCAFNKSIADELSRRVPAGCQAMTIHSLGFAAVRRAVGKPEVEGWKVSQLVEEITGKDWRQLKRSTRDAAYLAAISQFANLCRQSLTGWTAEGGFQVESITDEELDLLAGHYDVQMNGERERVYGDLRRLLTMIREQDQVIDFCDMVWLPIVNKYPVYRNELLLVDEAQDLDRCRQELAKLAGNRLILCGDPRQAIYGFAGADTDSMPRMFSMLAESERGCLEFPLTVTRRCGKAIVRLAQQIVGEEFTAHESNPEGEVLEYTEARMAEEAKAGDMILCRVNAPLISHAFRFLKAGRKANIQGRDIGEGLIRLVKKLSGKAVSKLQGMSQVKDGLTGDRMNAGDLLVNLDDWYQEEAQKLAKRKFTDESAQIALTDKKQCLEAFCEGAEDVREVVMSIERLFDTMGKGDNTKGCILLSSIHRAKGLEAPRVFILAPNLLPHPRAKTEWQRGQEMNLKYVAITRAIQTLVMVPIGQGRTRPVIERQREEDDE